ncbi:MAG: tRNA uridine-5-carboxymethylaminomethyl(34) synthesis GTPase MnmE [Nitrospirae bacterium CG_4_10_14_0_8_um_filter_41_23]|nr:tRNA uridine-5-carboxymethylaminomethyl(34) synthesis GTPase MnmE [Nitrospirota bacterium]OIP61259.1 MAG: tRNA uridine-5-carboxymethylaminomethyl(34) synthesis GTPase MnmE [Nitrospirae bacterium CG2_30_41_42]PIQ94747.1 MAG: tRNA uridine-5-carboxymethylaminomethyl(34) synthesis GTPase MnmE [Nitrospirae bacterium CG11_big_fil_rev_8_21_14_0_20_41_14]PIV43020.1 MAG: tRNA uridine-5-carboxymethylaminomethyl(34) synthesis GTPase MnmE [Nitrospirae bacterium CG02_land_8_20_14_3_00_41_53]PIW88121.1 MA
MFIDDTIAAISTPLGEGGIGIVRLSGKDSIKIAEKIFISPKNKSLNNSKSHRIIYGYIKDPKTDKEIDEVLITIMRSPYSYTREDVVEINCHGGMTALRKTLELILKQGARLAEPGEFTKRAFINGRIDLSQAEAVLDLIRSKTDESRRIAIEQLQGGLSEKITALRDRLTEVCAHVEAYIDFPEDEIETASIKAVLESMKDIGREFHALLKTYDEARFFREGLSTAIVGSPNVGKSSLLNALLKKDRAIVTEYPGTTRDVIEEYLNINGLPLRIMDTAGIRDVQDIAEKEGVKRSLLSIENADIVIAMFDCSELLKEEDFEVIQKVKDRNTIFVLNKSDLQSAIDRNSISSLVPRPSPSILNISATRGDGLEELKDIIFESCLKNWKEEREGVVITNLRHKTAIEKAKTSLERAISALLENQPLEILALELRDSLDRLGEIVGAITTEDILNKIFTDFCIGK